MKPTRPTRAYLAEIGARGGKVLGESKIRGDSEYYRRISALGAAARKRNREARDAKPTH